MSTPAPGNKESMHGLMVPGEGGTAWRKALLLWSILFVLTLLVLVVAPLIGQTRLDLGRLLGWAAEEGGTSIDREIFMRARLPRVVFGLIAGGGLALAGTVYQAILRNDLAEPYTLGVASGASLGAMLVFHLLPAAWGGYMIPMASLLFGGLALLVVYLLSMARGRMTSPTTLILAGVTLNFLFGSVILLIQYLSDPYQTAMMIRWLMGGLGISSWGAIAIGGLLLVAAWFLLIGKARDLNLLAMGDATAHNLGVSVEKTRLITLCATSVLAAYIVAHAGPIGFVGLLVPHILRRLAGADHRLLLPAVVPAGGIFLVVCDTGARTLFAPAELPVGLATAFLGAPFFLWLIFRRR